jgi:hypothetical protein
LSAEGEKARWRNQISNLIEGDLVVAYLARYGFVGVGTVAQAAVPMREFMVQGVPLCQLELAQPGMSDRMNDDELTEYLVRVDWIKAVDRSEACFESNSGLYTTQHIRASLTRQPQTIAYIEKSFGVNIGGLLERSRATQMRTNPATLS